MNRSSPRGRKLPLASSSSLWLLANVLQLNRQNHLSPARLLVALALVCALVAIGFLAVSPKAHACVHAHHNAPDHDCVVKHFADGKLLLPVLDAELPAAVRGGSRSPAAPTSILVAPVSHLLPAGRAPPTV